MQFLGRSAWGKVSVVTRCSHLLAPNRKRSYCRIWWVTVRSHGSLNLKSKRSMKSRSDNFSSIPNSSFFDCCLSVNFYFIITVIIVVEFHICKQCDLQNIEKALCNAFHRCCAGMYHLDLGLLWYLITRCISEFSSCCKATFLEMVASGYWNQWMQLTPDCQRHMPAHRCSTAHGGLLSEWRYRLRVEFLIRSRLLSCWRFIPQRTGCY